MNNHEMSQDFPTRIHQTLRAWHIQDTEDVLNDLLLAQQIETEDEIATPRLISNQILINGLDRLSHLDTDAANLIERRFLNKETAREIAYSLNVTIDVIYQRQRTAIEQLARVIWTREEALRKRHAQQITARLETPTYTRLFGVERNLQTLRDMLTTDTEPWILAIEGMGGIGKTSLADALARRLAYDTYFQDIAWISVRHRLFRLTGNIERMAERPSLTRAGLLDRLIDQFKLENLRRQTEAEKLIGVQQHLQSHRALVVIDNLETVSDYHTLLPRLHELTEPSKFLITTRYSLQGETGVYIYPLQPLSQDDTLALIRYEARNRGLLNLAQASDDVLATIYRATGGNPLAIKLVVGKLHTLSLPVVLQRLTEAEGKPTQELLDFLYADAWRSLDDTARRLMQALLLMPEAGGTIEQLAAATDLTHADAVDSLRSLAERSLVHIKGDLHGKRYALHQLTRTFVERVTTDEAT